MYELRSIKVRISESLHLLTILILGVIFGSCGKQVSVTPPDVPPPNAYIYIDSNPRGFDIYLDGKDRRRITPDSLTWLSTGSYKITLKKTLFRDSTFTINVTEGKKKSIYIDFSKNPLMRGSVSCYSNPEGAEIFINDSSTGKFTPAVIKNIFPGNYVIKYHLKNYQDASFNVTVSSGNSTSLSKTLVDTTLWKVFNTENSGIRTNDLICIAVDKNDVIWLGTDDGVISFDGINWEGKQLYSILPFWPVASMPTKKPVNCVAIDGNNTKFFGTDRGVASYDGTNAQAIINNLFSVNAIGSNNAGKLYVGTDSGLVGYNILNSPFSNRVWITSIFPDNSGNMWIGTHDRGIAIIRPGSVWRIIYTGNSPLINDYIRAFAQAPSGEIWVGFGTSRASGGVLASYDGTSWQNHYILKSTNQTVALLVDKNNTKWVATNQGLIKFSTSSTIVIFNYDNTGLNIDNPTGLAQDSKGNIWISTKGGGLIEYKGNH